MAKVFPRLVIGLHVWIAVLFHGFAPLELRAQSDLFALEVVPKDGGQVETHVVIDPKEIQVKVSAGDIEVQVGAFLMVFGAPSGTGFSVGAFPKAGMSLTGGGLCTSLGGGFGVLEFEMADGVIQHLWIISQQQCQITGAVSILEIRYRSLKAGRNHPRRLIRVPQDVANLKTAVDIAVDGLTVEVGPGVYQGGIQIESKSVRLVSTDGADSTLIQGVNSDAVVSFINIPGSIPSLEGFTIRGGGRGCYVYRASPLIARNSFELNQDPLFLQDTFATVVSNRISDSLSMPLEGGTGTGIWIEGQSGPRIEYNHIERTPVGVFVHTPSRPLIWNNRIEHNTSGVLTKGATFADVAQNVIANNLSFGIQVQVDSGSGPSIRLNTLYGNEDGGVLASGDVLNLLVDRNIISGNRGLHLSANIAGMPTGVKDNMVQSPRALAFIGSIPNLDGIAGNSIEDPQFVYAVGGDFRLMPTSSALDRMGFDVGFLTDIDKNWRRSDSQSLLPGLVDLGAYEYLYGPPRPNPSLVAASKPESVMLTWSPFDLAQEYEVRRASSRFGSFELIASVNETSFEDHAVVPGTLYYYTVAGLSDVGLGASTAPVGGRPANRAPIAVDEIVVGDEDAIFEARILDNDTDPDGDPLTYRIVSRPSHCILHALENRALIRAEPNWFGTDFFVYETIDAAGGVSTGRVTIQVRALNDPPEIISGGFGADADRRNQLFIQASDIDGDAISLRIVTPPSHGILTLLRSRVGVSYVPAHGYRGVDRFEAEPYDKQSTGAAKWYTVEIWPIPDADGDSLPDPWEAQYGVSDPTADSDSDGVSNYGEYLALTSPVDPSSILKFDAVVRTPAGIRLEWSAFGSVRYKVLSSEDGNQWLALTTTAAEEIDATNPKFSSNRSFLDSRPLLENGARFYRLQVGAP